ncbi:MAG: BON domain-containing protein [Thermoguttaceae bacterium]
MRQVLVLSLTACLIAGSVWSVKADNQESANRIAASLSQQFPNRDFVVVYNDGTVILQGVAGSALEMQKALQTVSRQEGVKLVENKMTIATPSTSLQPVAPQPNNAVIPAGIFEKSGTQQPTFVSYNAEMTAGNEHLTPPISPVLANQSANPTSSKLVSTQPAPAQLPKMNSRPAKLAPVSTAQVHSAQKQGKISPVGMQSNYGSQIMPGQVIYEEVVVDGTQVPYNMSAQQGQVPSGAYARGPRDYSYQQQQGTQMCGQPNLPPYAWPSYAAHPNYAQVTYPKKYQPGCWPAIGPFYPYPQPPMEWRKVTLEWHDGSWWMDFDDGSCKGPFSPLFRERRH